MYYFDNNSTTLIYDENVKNEITNWISCGNPSNILHTYGQLAKDKIDLCRNIIAKKLSVFPDEIYFTSGATESNNISIQGIINNYLNDNKENKIYTIITSTFEHPSVLNIFKNYQNNPNLNIVYLNPELDKNNEYYGCINPDKIENIIQENHSNSKHVIFISIMHANNETGAINDIYKIGQITRKYGILFHCDATQSIGKYLIKPKEYNIHFMSFSGHKFHGPKGIGCLYMSKDVTLTNLCFGGEQEFHKRPGTENVANIAGITAAFISSHEDRDDKNKKLYEKKIFILKNLKNKTNFDIIGPTLQKTLPNTLLLMLHDIKKCNVTFVKELNTRGICISVGSACQTGKQSHVLNSMNIPEENRIKIIRISLSDYNTIDECKYLVANIIDILKQLP